MSTCLNSYDLLFHAAQGEDESYLDKSSCASGGPTLDNPFSSPSAIVAGETHADRLPSPPAARNLLRPAPLGRRGLGVAPMCTPPPRARETRRETPPFCVTSGIQWA